jgi:hypothetical protein
MKWYSLKKILAKHCRYNIIFGLRSNGKSYAVLEHALIKYLKTGKTLGLIRRYREDFRGKRGQAMFSNLECNGNGENIISKLTKGKYSKIIYNASRWYLAYWDNDMQKYIHEDEPFCYAFALSEMEHDKSTSFPTIGTILFDEFITRAAYLPDEFILFMNCLSTIIRHRNDVEIFMCANTVSGAKYNPYFKEMGLKHVSKMQPGDINVYTYGQSDLKVAVEFSDSPTKNRPSDVYFAFDNPKLAMITGQGDVWELDIYPHITHKIDKKDICYSYFIKFEEHLLQADIIINDHEKYTFIHLKTTPIKNDFDDIVFCLTPDERYNYYVNLLRPTNDISKKIISFFLANKVFYQSNDIGEVVNQYLNNCRKALLK